MIAYICNISSIQASKRNDQISQLAIPPAFHDEISQLINSNHCKDIKTKYNSVCISSITNSTIRNVMTKFLSWPFHIHVMRFLSSSPGQLWVNIKIHQRIFSDEISQLVTTHIALETKQSNHAMQRFPFAWHNYVGIN